MWDDRVGAYCYLPVIVCDLHSANSHTAMHLLSPLGRPAVALDTVTGMTQLHTELPILLWNHAFAALTGVGQYTLVFQRLSHMARPASMPWFYDKETMPGTAHDQRQLNSKSAPRTTTSPTSTSYSLTVSDKPGAC